MRRRRGFTLIELMVTIAILAFIIALALPSYHDYTTAWTCKNAAQILYADLLSQRRRAFSTCLSTGITINANGVYVLWETYNTAASLQPELHCASLSHDSVPPVLQLLLAFIPAGCDPVVPYSSPVGTEQIRVVDLSKNFSRPVQLNAGGNDVMFIPKRSNGRSDFNRRWAYSYIRLDNNDITTDINILVACGVETSVVTITTKGDIILN